MEGGGSLRLANWLYRVAPKDGTVMGTIGRGTGFDPILGQKGAQFDGTKFTWIGSANNEVSVCVAWNATSGITKFDDLFTKEITVGGTSMSADTDQFPRILDGILGTKMRIVSGYPGGNDVVLAMERGEVQGRCGWSWSSVMSTHKAWLDEKKMTVLIQLALRKHPDLPDVPLIMDVAKTPEQKQILRLIFARQVMGRPYLAPPGIPADRAEALRKAFMETMEDPEFVADAEKEKLEITPVPGDELQKLVADVYSTPPAIAQKAAAILGSK
jgi:tripartite-type tricarboxylate transporter receptor subunit TctC